MKLPLFRRSELPPVRAMLKGLPTRYLNPGELEALIALAFSVKPRGVLEFGCNNGRTAAALLHNIAGIKRYQGIDVLPGYEFEKQVQRAEVPTIPGELARHDPRFELFVRKRGSFDLTAQDLAPCDFAFIDGDHSRKAIEHDRQLALELVRPGGMIVYHDYHDLGTVDVRDVLHDLHAAGVQLRHVEGTWLAFEWV